MKKFLAFLLFLATAFSSQADNTFSRPVEFLTGSSLTIDTGVQVTGESGSIWDLDNADVPRLAAVENEVAGKQPFHTNLGAISLLTVNSYGLGFLELLNVADAAAYLGIDSQTVVQPANLSGTITSELTIADWTVPGLLKMFRDSAVGSSINASAGVENAARGNPYLTSGLTGPYYSFIEAGTFYGDGSHLTGITGGGGGDTITRHQTAFYEPTGDDGTAEIGNPAKPFATVQGALTAFEAGSYTDALVDIGNNVVTETLTTSLTRIQFKGDDGNSTQSFNSLELTGASGFVGLYSCAVGSISTSTATDGLVVIYENCEGNDVTNSAGAVDVRADVSTSLGGNVTASGNVKLQGLSYVGTVSAPSFNINMVACKPHFMVDGNGSYFGAAVIDSAGSEVWATGSGIQQITTADNVVHLKDSRIVGTNNSAATTFYADVFSVPHVDASGFDGNLTTSDDTLQEVAQAVDDLILGAGGDVATDTIWDAKGDLAVGTGADTAVKLSIGANDTIAIADSTQTSGIRWGTPASVRTALGGTTVGQNLFTSTNPSAISFPKVAADNTVSYRTPAQVLGDIGAQAAGSYVLQSTTVNGHALSANVTVTASDLGATTVGGNIFALANPSAISFVKIAADNTVSTRTPAQVLSDIGAQAAGTYVTSVSGTAPIVSSGGTTPAISITAATTGAAGSMSSADKTKLDAITGTNTGDQVIPHTVTFTADGAGTVLATGTYNPGTVGYGGTLQKWKLVCKPSGSVTVDIYRAADGAGLPVTSIVGGSGTKPSVSSGVENSSTSFTSWTSTTITAWDNLAINVTSATTCTYCQLVLTFQ